MTDKELQTLVQSTVQNNGSLDDVVAQFTSSEKGSEEYKAVKTKVSQRLTDLRSNLRKMCESKGLPVSRVDVLVPTFRRKSTKQADINDLFEQISKME